MVSTHLTSESSWLLMRDVLSAHLNAVFDFGVDQSQVESSGENHNIYRIQKLEIKKVLTYLVLVPIEVVEEVVGVLLDELSSAVALPVAANEHFPL